MSALSDRHPPMFIEVSTPVQHGPFARKVFGMNENQTARTLPVDRQTERRELWIEIYTASMKSQMNGFVIPGSSHVTLAVALADESVEEYDARFK